MYGNIMRAWWYFNGTQRRCNHSIMDGIWTIIMGMLGRNGHTIKYVVLPRMGSTNTKFKSTGYSVHHHIISYHIIPCTLRLEGDSWCVECDADHHFATRGRDSYRSWYIACTQPRETNTKQLCPTVISCFMSTHSTSFNCDIWWYPPWLQQVR
jgi:hypothetical protein